jgi:solute carrier family 38 (sodium-coupled neutral amino acid transporter), member 11
VVMIGIIGLPYALRRAGIILGIILLFVLTAVVDWTIRCPTTPKRG